ncbi:MAG: hypothetical protein CR217_04965 [Beijerinckiaceae bacterium]|nr:MAG: hypothetical protein CR217_04965 [Beijerinckiaceae bacterium]
MPGKPSEGGDWVTLLNNVFEQLVRFERDYGWKATVILIVIALILISGGFIAAWGLQEWSKKSLQKELSLLRSAESVDTDLRARRHETYSRLWNLTRLLTAWPEKIPTYCELPKLSQDMCDWYYNNNFDGGGMYLSTGAMAHYRMAQAALAVFDNVKSNEALHNQESKDLRQYLGGLRTELTKDLLSCHGPFERDIGKLKRKHEDKPALSGGAGGWFS